MNNHFRENKDGHRFELDVGGATAYADFCRESGTLYVDYVFAPPELRGSGAAGELMQEIVSVANNENLKIVPICGYAASWLKRHKS